MDNITGNTEQKAVKLNIFYNTIVETDDYLSYNKIKDTVWTYIPAKVPSKEASKILPWLHTLSKYKTNFIKRTSQDISKIDAGQG